MVDQSELMFAVHPKELMCVCKGGEDNNLSGEDGMYALKLTENHE